VRAGAIHALLYVEIYVASNCMPSTVQTQMRIAVVIVKGRSYQQSFGTVVMLPSCNETPRVATRDARGALALGPLLCFMTAISPCGLAPRCNDVPPHQHCLSIRPLRSAVCTQRSLRTLIDVVLHGMPQSDRSSMYERYATSPARWHTLSVRTP